MSDIEIVQVKEPEGKYAILRFFGQRYAAFRCNCGFWTMEAGLTPHDTHKLPASKLPKLLEAVWPIL